jgi:hypothetical protein
VAQVVKAKYVRHRGRAAHPASCAGGRHSAQRPPSGSRGRPWERRGNRPWRIAPDDGEQRRTLRSRNTSSDALSRTSTNVTEPRLDDS